VELADIVLSRPLQFVLLSAVNVAYSWHSLHNPHTHGFYRFFIFEGIAALFILQFGTTPAINMPSWPRYLALLFNMTALLLAAAGYLQLRRVGGHHQRIDFPANHYFENTAQLVTTGIYGYIRHPMYSALLLFTWGLVASRYSWFSILIALLTSAILWIAVRVEEQENIAFFGEAYREYMRQTRRFIPFLI